MRIYKPIEGLLPGEVPTWRRHAWWAVPSGVVLLLLVLLLQGRGERESEVGRWPGARLVPTRAIGHASGVLWSARQHAALESERGWGVQAPVVAQAPTEVQGARAGRAEPPAAKPEVVSQGAGRVEAPTRGSQGAVVGASLGGASPLGPVSPPPAEGQAALGEVMGPSLPPGFVRVGQPSPLVAQDMAREEVSPAVVVPGQEGLIEGKINPGQGIYDALVACRLSPGKIQPVLDVLGKVVDFKKAKAGDPFVVRYDAQGKIVELSYQPSAEVTHTAKLVQGQYKTSDKKTPLELRLEGVAGTVKTSVYAGLRDLGLSQATITRFSDIFSNDINFASESKPGDTFKLVFEKVYVDKKFLKNGDLVAVEYKTPKKTVRLLYDKPSGSWYSPEGKSSKRVYIQNPVPFARVTSKFGKRLHPVLKRWKMHNGVDYAAPTGTPVKAIAAGKVVHLAPSGASGNLIGVQHSNGTSSFYAHLSKFAASLKKGDQVKQGQVIGYVGSTGRSTGPHLHLAIKVGGAYVDPLSADAVRSGGLGGNELRVFRRDTRAALQRLDGLKVQPPSAGPAEPEPQGGDEE